MALTTAGCRFLHQLFERGLPGDRENNLAHNAVGIFQRGVGDVEQNAGLAPNLNRISEQFLYHTLLGLDRDPMGDLNQELDQAVDNFALTGHAIEGQQRQADAIGVTSQLPGGLNRRTPAKTLGESRMRLAKQICRQRESADELEFGDLGEQAPQTDATGIG